MDPPSSRRGFFTQFLGKALTWFDEARGRQQLAATGLRGLAPEVLSEVIPVINREFKIEVEEDQVLAQHPKAETKVLVCRLDQPQLNVFNLFTGTRSLEQVSREFARQQDMEPRQARQMVEEFFFHLAENGLCLPRDPLPDDYYYGQQDE